MDFRKLLPFPLEKYPTDKKKSSTTLKSANPRSQQLEDNPQGQGRTQVSSETRQAHIKTASWGDDCFNATDPGSGYPFSLVAPTATTSNRWFLVYGLKNSFQMTQELLWGEVPQERFKYEQESCPSPKSGKNPQWEGNWKCSCLTTPPIWLHLTQDRVSKASIGSNWHIHHVPKTLQGYFPD